MRTTPLATLALGLFAAAACGGNSGSSNDTDGAVPDAPGDTSSETSGDAGPDGDAPPPEDADAVDTSDADTSDADTEDPHCHYDCFGWFECQDGVVTKYAHTPVPCWAWRGSCPIAETYTCERGCWTTGAPQYRPWEPASAACEESRPKQVGDPCAEPADCRPEVATWTSGANDVTSIYLRCNEEAGRCEAREPPTPPEDWLGPCGVEDDGQPGDRYGALSTARCSGGACIYLETATCVRQGCTIACASDGECPLGARCAFDTMVHGLCVPGAPGALADHLACPRAP